MLEAIGYARLAEHRLQHENFRRMLRQLLSDSRSMTLDQIADRIEALINGWFYQHILTVDIEYVAAARAHQGPSSSASESTR